MKSDNSRSDFLKKSALTTAALRKGQFVTFDEEKQEVLAGGKVFQY